MELYRKYRPTSFAEVIGQKDVVDQLNELLRNPDPPHAYLFTGPTGCGKTTLGRILARELGAVEQDFIEIDSADFRGIDMVRDIRRNASYFPLCGNRRVWLIDEAHKLTNDAQNALLKGIEDPPAHCYYILCTTEPRRVIDTLRGRCKIFTVAKLSELDTVRMLTRIALSEDHMLDRPLLESIYNRSEGHPRNAIQLLEQVIASSPDSRQKTIDNALAALTQGAKLAYVLLHGRGGWSMIQQELLLIDENEVEGVRRGVMAYCAKALLASGWNESAGLIMEAFKEPFFNNGVPGMVLACCNIVKARGGPGIELPTVPRQQRPPAVATAPNGAHVTR